MPSSTILLSIAAILLATALHAQPTSKVDYAKEIAPLLRQNCVSCHGPSKQLNGLRVDRKSSVMKVNLRRVVPGSSQNSFLYHRVAGGEYGMQMPPTNPLKPEQIALLKAWIEQGADWPENLANEMDLPPLNPKAIAMVESLRSGDLAAFLSAAKADRKLLNARGPEGSTPFMYAVLHATTGTLGQLIKMGADVNAQNDERATPLMWAVTDLAKTKLLLGHKADVNARSADLRTPLMIAARVYGNSAVMKLLLDRGAKLDPNGNPGAESSPLIEAATTGDPAMVQFLLGRGADVKAVAQPAMSNALFIRCFQCFDMIMAKVTDKAAFTGTLQDAAIVATADTVRKLLDKGADINAYDPLGRTPLMYAVGSDLLPADVVKLMIERGANVNAKSRHTKSVDNGVSVLEVARLRGDTPVVQLLLKAGAKGVEPARAELKPRLENTIRRATQDGLPMLQRADIGFSPKAGCISCHNNSLTAMATGAARKNGFQIDEKIAAQQLKANVSSLETLRDRLHQGIFTPVGDIFGPFVIGYMLIGLEAEGHKPDLNTDAAAFYLKMHQMPDGQWIYPVADQRPPICHSYVSQTALAMRGLQLYAPATRKAEFAHAVNQAARWLAKVAPLNNEDRSWRVIGLAWAASDKAATQAAMADLLSKQRPDGGWADLDTMESAAYATGKALVALQAAGMPVSDPAYKRGMDYLLKTQQQDGSWYVKTRALALQPFFDAGFPHAYDQYMSTAGTGWATIALALASK